ncbi:MAG: metallophosphatase, partial [Methanobrevibacter sp.]|nr:metallophosphatase [Methanobrevibacter sp.]
MSFRQKRVLLSTPFYALFEFFLLKYIFLLIGGVNDIYIISLAVIIGLMRIVPMFLESRTSTPFGRFLSTLDG